MTHDVSESMTLITEYSQSTREKTFEIKEISAEFKTQSELMDTVIKQ